jgi:hypothetical protein
MLKELTRPSPPQSAVFPHGAVEGDTAPNLLLKDRGMIIEVPAHESEQLPNDAKPKDLVHKSKTTFHWPPDCLWPFIEHGSEDIN